MNDTLYGIYGASGCGRGVMPLAASRLAARGVAPEQLVFIDDVPASPVVNGHQVLTFDAFRARPEREKLVCLAIASGTVRQALAAKLDAAGIGSFSVQAENVVIMDDVIVGEGAILSPFVTLTSNIRIGRHFHANLYSYVEHDCVIGDFVTFGPAAKCNGNIHIHDHAYIGSGAVIKQGRPGAPLIIGRGATVGMGAVVTRDVPPGVTVVGNPARPLQRKGN